MTKNPQLEARSHAVFPWRTNAVRFRHPATECLSKKRTHGDRGEDFLTSLEEEKMWQPDL